MERKLTNPVEVTPEMIEAGVKAGWHDAKPPAVCFDLAERIYRAMEAKRRESEHL